MYCLRWCSKHTVMHIRSGWWVLTVRAGPVLPWCTQKPLQNWQAVSVCLFFICRLACMQFSIKMCLDQFGALTHMYFLHAHFSGPPFHHKIIHFIYLSRIVQTLGCKKNVSSNVSQCPLQRRAAPKANFWFNNKKKILKWNDCMQGKTIKS